MASSVIISVPSAFAARRSTTSQSIPSGIITTVVCNDELYDTHNQYNPSTGLFTCAIPGFWTFSASARVAGTTQNISTGLIQFIRNNTTIRGNEFSQLNTPVLGMTQTYGANLIVGDLVIFQVTVATTGGDATIIPVQTDFEYAHFSGSVAR